MKENSIIAGAGLFLLLIVVGVFALIDSVTLIPAGHQGIVTRFGAIQNKTLEPGIHWITPFTENAIKYDVREQKEEAQANAASSDLQTVSATVAVNYHLDPANVNRLYSEVGRDYKSRIIDPAVQESVKAATARYTVSELITRRAEVKQAIKEVVAARLSSRYIILDDVSITNFSFSAEFDKAIEAKQVAEQSAQKARQDLDRIRVEAEQRVAQAQAEAEAIKIQSEAIQQSGGANYINLKWVEKWNGAMPQYSGLTGTPLIQLPSAQ